MLVAEYSKYRRAGSLRRAAWMLPLHLSVLLAGLFIAPPPALGQGVVCTARDEIGTVDVGLDARAVHVEYPRAYVVGLNGLVILDITDRQAPIEVGALRGLVDSSSIVVRDDIAIIGMVRNGVAFVDISDPAAPTLLTTLPTEDRVYGICLSGPYLFAAEHYAGLGIFNIEDPRNPTRVGSVSMIQLPRDVVVDGAYAYVAHENHLSVLDLTDIEDIELLSTTPIAGGAATCIARQDDTVVVGALQGPGSLTVLNTADPMNPTTVATVAGLLCEDVLLQDMRAYVAAGRGGMVTLDLSVPDEPQTLAMHGTFDRVHGITADDGVAYLANGSAGVTLIDVTDPAENPVLGTLGGLPEDRHHIDVAGTLAALALGTAGVAFVDVSNPTEPTLLSLFDTASFANGVTLHGDRAYIADGGAGLLIVDVSDPAAPLFLGGWLGGGGGARKVRIDGDRAYVHNFSGRIYIIDIADPRHTVVLGSILVGSAIPDFEVEWPVVAAAADQGGVIRFWDVSDPQQPEWFESVRIGGNPKSVEIADGLVFATNRWDCHIIAHDAWANLRIVGSTPGIGVSVEGDYALVGAPDIGGVIVVDVSDPTNPVPLARSPVGGMYIIRDGLAYMFGSEFSIVDLSDCPPCLADFNDDSTVDTRDFVAFLNAWATERSQDCSAGGCLADFDNNGTVDTRDFVGFLNAWAAGC